MPDTRRLEIHREQRPTWLDAMLFIAAFAAMFFNLGTYGLFEPHEAHFAGVGRENAAPWRLGYAHLNARHTSTNRPPLLDDPTSYALFGINEWARACHSL